jgi:hypothetical protein
VRRSVHRPLARARSRVNGVAEQPKGAGANIAVWRVGRWPGAMTVIAIRRSVRAGKLLKHPVLSLCSLKIRQSTTLRTAFWRRGTVRPNR